MTINLVCETLDFSFVVFDFAPNLFLLKSVFWALVGVLLTPCCGLPTSICHNKNNPKSNVNTSSCFRLFFFNFVSGKYVQSPLFLFPCFSIDGSLGSKNDEGCSEVRHPMRIASLIQWTDSTLNAHCLFGLFLKLCLLRCLLFLFGTCHVSLRFHVFVLVCFNVVFVALQCLGGAQDARGCTWFGRFMAVAGPLPNALGDTGTLWRL